MSGIDQMYCMMENVVVASSLSLATVLIKLRLFFLFRVTFHSEQRPLADVLFNTHANIKDAQKYESFYKRKRF